MNLYQIHCGFYDNELFEGVYEFHVNIPVVAQTKAIAKKKVKEMACFHKKKMHIDGIEELKTVDNHRIILERIESKEKIDEKSTFTY